MALIAERTDALVFRSAAHPHQIRYHGIHGCAA